MPYIEMLKENNTRRGFFERDQFEAVRAHLPAYARPPATFAYITGWRLKRAKSSHFSGDRSTTRRARFALNLGRRRTERGAPFQ